MNAIRIRPATTADSRLLAGLLAAAYQELKRAPYDPHVLEAALPMMSRANPKLLSCGTYYLAECDGFPAACGGWTFERPGSGEIVLGIAHVRHFATHPDHLRKGLGRMLLDRCLGEARTAGAHIMKCQSTLPAERFYAAAGFHRKCEVQVEMAPGISLPAIEMERRLA